MRVQTIPLPLTLMAIIDLFLGLSCIYFLLEVFLAHHSDQIQLGVFGASYTASIGLAGIGIATQQDWGYRIAKWMLNIAVGVPLIVGIVALASSFSPDGDFANAKVNGGIMLFCAMMFLALLPWLERRYLLKNMD